MTDDQRYSEVLKELGELLQSKNTTINSQRWQIDNLTEELVRTKYERDEAIAELKALHKGGASK